MNKTKYNHALLEYCIKRDNAICIQEYNKLNRETKITFICSCGKENCEKVFRTINKVGAFCKICTNRYGQEKKKQTYIKNFGVENPSQSEEIKNKMKNTNLKKFGVENPMQSEVIKEKMKETNFKRFGVEYASQNEKIKNKKKETSIKNFGVEYPSQSADIKNKIKETNLKKFGVENPMKSEEVKNKMKETNLQRFGVEYSFQSEEIKNKIKKTILSKFGVEHPLQSREIREKMKETNLSRFGVEYASQNDEIKEKRKETNLEKFGVEYPLQNEEIAEKSSKNAYKRKEVITPSGKTITFQGYEPFAYKILLETYKEEEIITSRNEVPEIWWIDNEGKKHRYFVDFFIKKDNLMIEIKSQRTFSLDDKKEKIEKTLQESRKLGYNMELWILDPKGNILQKIFN